MIRRLFEARARLCARKADRLKRRSLAMLNKATAIMGRATALHIAAVEMRDQARRRP